MPRNGLQPDWSRVELALEAFLSSVGLAFAELTSEVEAIPHPPGNDREAAAAWMAENYHRVSRLFGVFLGRIAAAHERARRVARDQLGCPELPLEAELLARIGAVPVEGAL